MPIVLYNVNFWFLSVQLFFMYTWSHQVIIVFTSDVDICQQNQLTFTFHLLL